MTGINIKLFHRRKRKRKKKKEGVTDTKKQIEDKIYIYRTIYTIS